MKQLFWTGLVILLPVAVTLWFAKILFEILAKPFGDFSALLVSNCTAPLWTAPLLSQTLSILFLFILIFFIGMLGRWVVVHWFLHAAERLVARIPFVNKVYKACKDFTHILFAEKTNSFSKVVIVPFPSEKQQAVGLLTNTIKTDIISGIEEEFCTVLLPGTPNPTVGFLLFLHKTKVLETEAKVDEALKFIMSCGTANGAASKLR